jgi:predicted glycosyltransferase
MLEIFTHIREGQKLAQEFQPTVILGFGVDAALLAALLKKPGLVFTDCEPMRLQNRLNTLWASAVITPDCFLRNLGSKQVRVNSLKELAYLNPDRFHPDPSIYHELGIEATEKFAVLRFNVFDAVHDIGRKGFSIQDKQQLCRELQKYARIFISPEGTLPYDLEQYKLTISPARIHHVLYYAQLVISDTGTMTTEAAVLGTPGIICLSNVAQFGNFMELEHNYELLYAFSHPDPALEKAVELLKRPELKVQWTRKRQKLLAEKIDFTHFVLDLVQEFSDCRDRYKEAVT